MIDLGKYFSRSSFLSSPKLVIELDESLTLPVNVLFNAACSSSPVTYEHFNVGLKKNPSILQNKIGDRVAYLRFSDVYSCGVQNVTKEEIDSILKGIVPTSTMFFSRAGKLKNEVFIEFTDKEEFAKAVEVLREKLPNAFFFYTSREDKNEIAEPQYFSYNASEEKIKQYSMEEILEVYSSMDMCNESYKSKNNDGNLKEVLRYKAIKTLSFGDEEKQEKQEIKEYRPKVRYVKKQIAYKENAFT